MKSKEFSHSFAVKNYNTIKNNTIFPTLKLYNSKPESLILCIFYCLPVISNSENLNSLDEPWKRDFIFYL
jgi:hypothetical protein